MTDERREEGEAVPEEFTRTVFKSRSVGVSELAVDRHVAAVRWAAEMAEAARREEEAQRFNAAVVAEVRRGIEAARAAGVDVPEGPIAVEFTGIGDGRVSVPAELTAESLAAAVESMERGDEMRRAMGADEDRRFAEMVEAAAGRAVVGSFGVPAAGRGETTLTMDSLRATVQSWEEGDARRAERMRGEARMEMEVVERYRRAEEERIAAERKRRGETVFESIDDAIEGLNRMADEVQAMIDERRGR